MKNLKHILLPMAALFALLTLCACGSQTNPSEPAEDKTDSPDMSNYNFTLPDNCTTEEEKDGSVSLLYDGTVVGGITTISYTNASELDPEDIDRDLSPIWNQVLTAEENTPDYILEDGFNNSLKLFVVTDQRKEEHNLFPDGDQFYDLWFQENALPDEAESALLNSFSLN